MSTRADSEDAVPPMRSRFTTTHWSLVLAAGERSTAEAEQALARLCSRYWYPVFAFVRRQGHSSEDARDLTQSFFARVIEKGDLAAADRTRGRFRTFLLTACSHFLSNQRDRERAAKRGGGRVPVPIDLAEAEGRYERALSHGDTPERLYERQWCLALLAAALESLRREYETAGRPRVFGRLERFLAADDAAGGYEDAALELGMTIAAVKTAVHRLRRRYREELRRQVADTLERPEEGDDELRSLLESMAR